jgi:glycosyltransferase 2 family protein
VEELAASAAPKREPRKRLVRYSLRLGLGIALLVWLAGQGGASRIGVQLAGLSPAWFLPAVALYLVGQSLCAWKWAILAEQLGFRQPLGFYWTNYLGAMFPSLFLPTSLGGDVMRVAVLARGGDRVRAGISVLADRGTGFLAMVWIAAGALLLSPAGRGVPPALAETVYALAALLSLGLLLPFAPAMSRLGMGRLTPVLECWQRPGRLLLALAAALSFQLLLCVIYMLLGRSLAIPIPKEAYFLICPLASVAGLSPLTVNGLGERTAALVLLMGTMGGHRDQAIALSIAWTALVTLASLFGAAVLFWRPQATLGPAEAPPTESPA